MAFNIFGKKKEVVDFRPRDSDMPVPQKIKDRLIAGKTNSVSSGSTSEIPTTAPSGGGFFNFFGSSNDNSSTSSAPIISDSTASEVKTDFFGNPLNSSSPVSSSTNSFSSSSTNLNETRIDDVSTRLSRLLDRVELLEKKMDRLDRRDSSY